MKPSLAVGIGSVCLLAAALIGAYFLTLVFYPLFPILAYGFVAIILYTPLLSKIPAVSEIIAGSGFGFMALGAYVTQAGVIDKTGLSILAPVSILVGLLLFLNEFPDMEADMTAGRRHIVVLFGRKSSALIYVAGLIAAYLSIVVAVVANAAPVTVLISLATVPIAFRAGRLALKYYGQVPDLVPALASNVMVVLSTILLIAVGFLLGSYL
jgi:1,4-dihydroxy-2-naphthoate octaprenyltransferase